MDIFLIVIQIICVVALVCYLALLVLVGRNARDKASRAFLLFLLAMMAWQFSVTMVVLTNSASSAYYWYSVSLALGSGFGFFYAIFVREFLGIRGNNWIVWLGYAVAVIIAVHILSGGAYVIEDVYQAPQTGMWLPTLGFVSYLMSLYLYGPMAYGMYHLAKRYRTTSSSLMRNRIRYLLVGVSLVFAGSAINLSDTLKVYPIDIVANVLNALLIAYAILRFQLLDISLVVRKGLVYSIPTIIIGAGYLLVIFLTVNLFHLVAGYEVLLISLVVAGIVALLLQPLRDKTQLWVDRLFFREKYDTSLMLQRLSRTASSVLDIDELASMILDEISETIHIAKAALFLKETETGGYSLVAQRGMELNSQITMREDSPIVQWLSRKSIILTRHTLGIFPQFKGLWGQERKDLEQMETELFTPLIAREQLIGILMVGPKRSEESYSPDEQRTLMTLANQTAMAVQNAWLYQAAIDEKERTEIIIHQAFAGIMVVDQDMRITSANPGAEHITGYTSQEMLGNRFTDVFEPTLWNEKSSLYTAMTTAKSVAPVETALAGGDAPRDILLGVTPIVDGFLLNFTDITELKEVERLKSNIVANVSHELRTPLASIKGYTELLLDEYEGEDRHLRQKFLSIINDETDRLNKFISDLLDLSRLESGQVEPQMDYLYLDRVIAESLRTLNVQARKAGIDIHVDTPDDMPLILANKDLMTSVIKNLVSNAIKYSPSGGRVDVIVQKSGDSLVLIISDQGLGISSEDLPYLFTKFYRSGAAQRSGIGGSGLGLALAREAVEAHEGTISVQSEVDVGTCFTVTLPIPRTGTVTDGEVTVHPPQSPRQRREA